MHYPLARQEERWDQRQHDQPDRHDERVTEGSGDVAAALDRALDVVGQDHRDDRGTHRPCRLLHNVHESRTVGNLSRIECCQRGGHDRHHRHTHAEALDEQSRAEEPVRGVGADEDEDAESDRDQDDAGDHHLPGAVFVGQPTGHRHGEHRPYALRCDEQPGQERGLAADADVVLREQQHRTEERDHEQRHGHHRPRQLAVGEQPQVE